MPHLDSPPRRTTAAVVSAMTALLDGVDHGQRAGLGHQARLDLVAAARTFATRVDALLSVLVAEADEAGSSLAVKGTPLSTWLALSGQTSTKEANAAVFSGRDLTAQPQVRDAALAGTIGVRQARSIHKVLGELPTDLSDGQRQQAERLLLERAATNPADKLAAMREQVLAQVAPEHPEISRESELARLDAQRKRALTTRSLTFTRDGRGSTLFSGSLPSVEAARFVKIIDAYAESDRRRGRDEDDRLAPTRTPEQRRADALVAMLNDHQGVRQAPAVAGDRPRVVVVMQESDLRQRAEAVGRLDTGEPISARDLRRLCCDAELVPAVLGSRSEVLDIGRAQRLVTPAIRRALSLRDGGCAFTDCRKPDTHCEAHHIRPWWDGGATALDNLVLLCPHHHSLVEPPRMWSGPPPDRWQVRLDRNGLPEFIPPERVDPSQSPRPGNRPLALPGVS